MKMNQTLLISLTFSCLLAKGQLNYTQVTNAGLTACTFEGGPTEIELGDVDGDGDLDIVSIGDHGSPGIGTEAGVMVWKNNGTGTVWSYSKSGNFGYGGIALGDVNNDGKMDIGYGMHHNNSATDFGDQLTEVALGNGTGSSNSWTPYDDGLATMGEDWGTFGVDFADVNNDGRLDIASNAFGGSSGIHVYKNDGGGHWTMTFGLLGGNSGKWTQFGDFDNDGDPDVLFANEHGVIWENNGAGSFTLMDNGWTGHYVSDFDVEDVNNDGAKDIATASYNADAKVWYYDRSLAKWISISNGLLSTGCMGIQLDDMDMDGFIDAVIWKAGVIEIYKGDGAGNWVLGGSVQIPENELASFRTGDLDMDGFPDIIFMAKVYAWPSSGVNFLRVYLHNVNNPALNINPVNPKGFECFAPQSIQFLKWYSSVPAGPKATVTIEISTNGNSGPWTVVASNMPNSGNYQWKVPNVSSSNCFLKFIITNGSNTQTVTTASAFGIGNCTPATGLEENLSSNGFDVYPNPIIDQGYAHFELLNKAEVRMNITDILGNLVLSLVNETLPPGIYNPEIHAEKLNPGVYFCNLTVSGNTSVRKIIIAR